ncbi:MAG: hypothetical protein HRU19_10105 [Pseudobacteriovorax sp.]|nr:hypothetical protein [Pseudobacteriovorax sp.]
MVKLVGRRKERIKSVIVCKDREFKAKSVILLNGAAFPADKYSVERPEEALNHIDNDETVMNVVFEGSMYSAHDLEENLKKFAPLNEKEDVNFLCYVGESESADMEKWSGLIPRGVFTTFPLKQSDFNRAFHGKKAARKPSITHPDFKEAEKTPRRTGSLSAVEASQHLKETVDYINQIAKDAQNKAAMVHIGQRFNGLVGAFHYFGSKEGYSELRQLAECIDAVSRTYEHDDVTEVDPEHFSFIKRAAVSSYKYLQHLREQKDISDVLKAESKGIISEFHLLKGVAELEKIDQNTVDQLIETQKSS